MMQVPVLSTPITFDDAKASIRAGILGFERDVDPKLLAMLLAHSALETARWDKLRNYNFGNIIDPHGVWRHGYYILDKNPLRFRSYPHPEPGAADFVRLIRTKYEPAWNAALMGNVNEYAWRLKQGGYYAEPEGPFRNAMDGLYREFMGRLGYPLPLVEAGGEEPSSPSVSWELPDSSSFEPSPGSDE